MKQADKLKVAVVQRELCLDVSKNKLKIKDSIKEAAANGLLLLQRGREFF